MITITYFGNLKDILQCAQETIEWAGGDTDALLLFLRARNDVWARALAPENIFRVVINEEMTFANTDIKAGDRVALLPPVTGG